MFDNGKDFQGRRDIIALHYVASSLVDGEGFFEFMKTSMSDKSATHKNLDRDYE